MLNIRWGRIDFCIPEHFIWDHVCVSLHPAGPFPGAAIHPGELTASVTRALWAGEGRFPHPQEGAVALLKPSEPQWFAIWKGHDLVGKENPKWPEHAGFGPPSHPSKVAQQSLDAMARSRECFWLSWNSPIPSSGNWSP